MLSLIYFFFSHNTFYITNKCINAGKFRSRMWPDYKPASTGIPNQILQWCLSTSSVIMCTTCHVLPYQPNNKPLALTPNYTHLHVMPQFIDQICDRYGAIKVIHFLKNFNLYMTVYLESVLYRIETFKVFTWYSLNFHKSYWRVVHRFFK